MPSGQASIQTRFLNKMLIITFTSIALWSCIRITHDWLDFRSESALMRKTYIHDQKSMIKEEVDLVIGYLGNMDKTLEHLLEKQLKERVDQAHRIASHIYTENIGSSSLADIKKSIKDALRPIRFFDGRGYYFAVSMEGVEQLYPVQPEFEGQTMLDLQDSKGNYVIQDEIGLIRRSGEGFVRHFWSKPTDSVPEEHLKISYIKYFEPLDWYIGSGEYLDAAQKRTQAHVLDHLAALRFEAEGYFFGSTYDGEPLFSSGEITLGSDTILNLTDPNGIKIIQEQRDMVKKNGQGFVEYSWRKMGQTSPSPKVSFVVGYPKWHWVIGAGVYLDTIEQRINARRTALVEQLKVEILIDIVVLVILLITVFFWYKKTAEQINFSIHSFSRFLQRARTEAVTIDLDTLKLEEFKKIARSMNQMLKDRIKDQSALEKSEERFKLAMEATKDGLWDWNILTDEVYCSPGYVTMLGYESTGGLPGHVNSWKDLIHPKDSNMVLTANMDCVESRCNQFKIEFRMHAENGQWRWVLCQGKAVQRDKNGRAVRLVGTHTDITDQKIAEQNRSRNEQDLRKAQKIARLGSWHLDLETDEVFWTEELYKMYGFDPALPPPPYTEHMKLYTPKSWELLSASLADTRQSGAAYDLELETIREDGSRGWMWVTGEAVKNLEDKIIGIWGAAQDISLHKQTELALKESEERFRALHNASFGGIVIHDQGKVIECNRGVSDISGFSYDELIGMDGLLLISDETRDTVINNIQRGYEAPYEVIGVRKDGTTYPLRLEARNIPYKGKTVRTVEFRDITEQKEVEAEKKLLQVQLIQAQKMEAIGRLAGGVAHDFNNMLSIILGNTEIILDDLDPSSPLVHNLEEVQKAAQRSTNLTRQLLAFARKQTISPKILNLNPTIEGMLKMLKRLIGEDIDLSWHPMTLLWPVRIDPSQIDQILANLCVNARDSIKDVGRVILETDNVHFDDTYCQDHPGFIPGDFVVISISDNGCGMDKEVLDNLFEPFFTTKALGEGTGLGLATIYGIVKQNNGFVNVYSEIDKGTTFKIYLPRHTKEFDIQDLPAEQETLLKGEETILLVEDEHAILKMTKIMLERLGYKVMAAATPDQALAISHKIGADIDLLLTDVVMPSMNGRDLADKIIRAYPHIKCLYMSGYTANVIAHRGILDDGINFINKPFSNYDLSIRLRDILDG